MNELDKRMHKAADVQANDQKGWTALHCAVRRGSAVILKALIAGGADLEIRDRNGWSALHHAAASGKAEFSLDLIRAGADVNAKDVDRTTALNWAVFHGDIELVISLADAGADINAKDCHDRTVLDIVANGKTKAKKSTALALIAYGAINDCKWRAQTMKSLNGLSMHQAATAGGHINRMRVLLDSYPSGAPFDQPEALVKLARKFSQSGSAAFLQSHMASKAIEQMMEKSSVSAARL